MGRPHDASRSADQYQVELDLENRTDTVMVATTEHFAVKHMPSGKYVDKAQVRRWFDAVAGSVQHQLRALQHFRHADRADQYRALCGLCGERALRCLQRHIDRRG